MDGDDKMSSRLSDNGLSGINATMNSAEPEKSVKRVTIKNTTIDKNIKRTDVEGTAAVKINYTNTVMADTLFLDNVDIINNYAAGVQLVWANNDARNYHGNGPTILNLTMNNNDDSKGKSRFIEPMLDHATINISQEIEEYFRIEKHNSDDALWYKR